jgi:hypothetical protein
MTPKNARFVANAIVFVAGGAITVFAFRRPVVRRLLVRALPLILGGASPGQAVAFALSQAAIAASGVAAARVRGDHAVGDRV